MANYTLTLDIVCNKTTDIFSTPIFDFNKSDEVYFLIGAIAQQDNATNFMRFPRLGSKDGTDNDDTFNFLIRDNKAIVIGNFDSSKVHSTAIRMCEEDNETLAEIIEFIKKGATIFQSKTAVSVQQGIDWVSKTLDLKQSLQDDTIGSIVLSFDNEGTPSLQDEFGNTLILTSIGNNYISQKIHLNGSGASYDITVYLDAK